MSDLQILYDKKNSIFDLVLLDGDLALDQGLESSLLVSLFSDSLIDQDELPFQETKLRGWWADGVDETLNDSTGSKLWLLDRAKQNDENLTLAQTFAEQATQWLLDDVISSEIEVSTSYLESGVIEIDIDITKPQGNTVNYKFDSTWLGQANE